MKLKVVIYGTGGLGVKIITVTASHFFAISFDLQVSLSRDLKSSRGLQLRRKLSRLFFNFHVVSGADELYRNKLPVD